MTRKSVADAICKSDRVSLGSREILLFALPSHLVGLAAAGHWKADKKDERRDNSGDLVQLYSMQHEGASVIDDM